MIENKYRFWFEDGDYFIGYGYKKARCEAFLYRYGNAKQFNPCSVEMFDRAFNRWVEADNEEVTI